VGGEKKRGGCKFSCEFPLRRKTGVLSQENQKIKNHKGEKAHKPFLSAGGVSLERELLEGATSENVVEGRGGGGSGRIPNSKPRRMV